LVYENNHSKKQNMLEHKRLEKLVFIDYNLQILTKQIQPKDLDLIVSDDMI
jgi:hypothetical protein